MHPHSSLSPAPLRVLQVCNVGQIVGGTAACAWTITRALPAVEHAVAFLSPISGETRAAFAHADVLRRDRIAAADVAAIGPDVVILHNTPRGRADERLPALTVQYQHSRIAAAAADLTVYCSHWLAAQCGHPNGRVLQQAVPIPPRTEATICPHEARALRPRLVVGRLCTPQARKWPAELADFYRHLAQRFPSIAWEFVGCPPSLHALFRRACGDRALFHEPGWTARGHLWRWDALLYHHPTLTESFGRTCAEALRAGCVPLVDNRGGFREQLQSRSHQCGATLRVADLATNPGFLCDTPDDFAAALEALHDTGTRRRLSRAAQARGDERFSLQRFAADLLELLRALALHPPLAAC